MEDAIGWYEFAEEMSEFCKYPIIDSHVHIGEDADGKKTTIDDHLKFIPYGIERRVIFPFNELTKAETMPFYRIANENISRLVGQYPDSVIGFFRLYPGNFNSVRNIEDEMEHWKSQGLKGVKLRPGERGDEYNIADIGDVIEAAGREELPVIVHTDDKDPYADLNKLVEIAYDNPNTNIIAAHMGKGDTSGLKEAKKRGIDNLFYDPSVALEISISPFTYVLREIGPEYLVFGSDTPYRDPLIALQKINYISEMDRYKDDYLYPRNLEKILAGNMENLIV